MQPARALTLATCLFAATALTAGQATATDIDLPPPMPAPPAPAAEPPVRDHVPKPVEAFQPHRIVYKLEQVSLSNSATIRRASGKMFFEWADVCDAWTTTQKVQITYVYNDGQTVPISSDYESWESKDGASYAFSVQELEKNSFTDKVRGRADRKLDTSGQATYHLPANLSHRLPRDFKFPAAHTFEVLRKSAAGERFFSSTLFDGSDEEGPVLVNAVIGPVDARLSTVASLPDNELANSPARKVRLAFYAPDDHNATPQYEMSVVLHDNGMVSDMLIDYPEFSIHAVPEDVVALPDSGC
ncbi:MAG: cell envelope integrity EipB family protein [Alphaproteobacteria bacterium]